MRIGPPRFFPAFLFRGICSSTQYFEFTAVYPDCRMQMVRPSAGAAPSASKSSSHRRLESWHEDGTLNEIKARRLGLAQDERLICWTSGAGDGSFSPGKGGGAETAYGYKGNGILIHLLADDEMPLSACSTTESEDERTLLEMIAVKTGKPGRPPEKLRRIAADEPIPLFMVRS